jgi:DNA-directed RNA polymerase subunit RPC12/RpoP
LPAQPVCKQCGQLIFGNYITALGATWHPEHFVCAACHKPIGDASFHEYKGRPYHAECYLQQVAPRCAYCGKPLVGQYEVVDGKPYHPECYENYVAPRCAYCGKPLLGQYQIYQGKSYHPACFRDHVAPHCVYCGKPLTAEHIVNFWGEHYCKEHQAQYPACAFCGRLVLPQQQETGPQKSNSIRCPVCRSTAIETLNQAEPIFDRLKQWMVKQGLTFNNIPLTLELCDRATLSVYMRERGEPHTLGVTRSTTHSVNGREVRTEVNGIAVLRGMPKSLFQGVCIHELGHAWLVIQGIKGLPSWSEEGFCELLSYRYYTEMNTLESRYHIKGIEENPSPIYGDGFRRIRAIADRMGFSRFVEELRTSKRVPAR